MPSDVVELGDVLARSLADCEAYSNKLAQLRATQKRRREHEREWRTNLAARGSCPPIGSLPHSLWSQGTSR